VEDGERLRRGIEIIFRNPGAVIRNCVVKGYQQGLRFNYPTDAMVEGCILEGNQYGSLLCCKDNPESNPNPDFGGGARGSTGGVVTE
jgi:hypothetical protein